MPSAIRSLQLRPALNPDPEALRLLAELLASPSPGLAERAVLCARALSRNHPVGALALLRFAEYAAAAGMAQLEEAYTDAFELSPLSSPYVGDRLFGASRERSFFLADLRELRWAAGLGEGTELPDHVSELLRFAAAPVDAEVRDDLIWAGLLPSLRKMLAVLDEARHPWGDVLAAAVEALSPHGETSRTYPAEARP